MHTCVGTIDLSLSMQIRELDPQNDLKFLRLQSFSFEIMVAPYPGFRCVLVQRGGYAHVTATLQGGKSPTSTCVFAVLSSSSIRRGATKTSDVCHLAVIYSMRFCCGNHGAFVGPVVIAPVISAASHAG